MRILTSVDPLPSNINIIRHGIETSYTNDLGTYYHIFVPDNYVYNSYFFSDKARDIIDNITRYEKYLESYARVIQELSNQKHR